MKRVHTIPDSSPQSVYRAIRHEARNRLWKATIISGSAVLMMLPVVAPADDDWKPTNYEQRFEAQRKGIRLQENNVWVYKR